MRHSKVVAVIVGVVFVALGSALGYIVLKNRSTPTPSPTATPIVVQYTNNQYGLVVKLPATWQGFTTLNDSYTITNVATGAQEGTGVVIKIRNPQWTAAAPTEDLPIMVFTPANWNRVGSEQIAVGAAPIPPSLLARNSQYVFALPARYNFDYKTGWEEVQAIIDAHSISAFEPSTGASNWQTYMNSQYGFSVQYPSTVTIDTSMSTTFNVYFRSTTSAQSAYFASISIETKAQYQGEVASGHDITALAQNDKYVVISGGGTQDAQVDPQQTLAQQILATFQFTK